MAGILRSIKSVGVKGKKVLVRADLNVSVDDKGRITDDTRIRESLPTIKFLLSKGARIILMSHLGRPDGRRVKSLSMDEVGKRLSKLLNKKVKKINHCIGAAAEKAVGAMRPGDIVLLENLRFHKEEETNGEGFAKSLAALADIYVNDAFAASHRKHASIHRITSYLPSYAGLLLGKEISELSLLLEKPKRPFIVILGGAKVSDKLETIENLLRIADKVLIGGGMVFTFYKALGFGIGESVFDRESVGNVKRLVKNKKILLASDVLVSDNRNIKVVKSNEIPRAWKGVDIGGKSIKAFAVEIEKAKTIVWNGPLGIFEVKGYEIGTKRICEALAKTRAKTVIGGGDTIAACAKYRVLEKMSYISSGGGAMLEFLAGKKLPGVEALRN